MTEGAPKPITEKSWAETVLRPAKLPPPYGFGPKEMKRALRHDRYARQFQAQPYRSESREIDGVEYSFDPSRQIEARPYGKPLIPEWLLRAIQMGREVEASVRGLGEIAGKATEAAKGFGEAVAIATERSETAEGDTMAETEFAGIDFADSYGAKTCVFIVENPRPPATAMIVNQFTLDANPHHVLIGVQTARWQEALLEKGRDAIKNVLRFKRECLVTHPMIQRIIGGMMEDRNVEDVAGGWRKYLDKNRAMICQAVRELSRDHPKGWTAKEADPGWEQYIGTDCREWIRLQQKTTHPFPLKVEVFIDTDDIGIDVQWSRKTAKAFAWAKRPRRPMTLNLVDEKSGKLLQRDLYKADGTLYKRETARTGPDLTAKQGKAVHGKGTRLSESHGGGVAFPEDRMRIRQAMGQTVVDVGVDGKVCTNWCDEVKLGETLARERGEPGRAIIVQLFNERTLEIRRRDWISADGKDRKTELVGTKPGEREYLGETYEKTFYHNTKEGTAAKDIPMDADTRLVAMDTAVELARRGIEIRTDRIVGGMDAAGNVKGEVHTTEVQHGSPLICEHHAPTTTGIYEVRPSRPRMWDRSEESAERHIEYPGAMVEYMADLGRWRERMISGYRQALGAKGWPNCPVTRLQVEAVVGRMPRKRGTDPNAEKAIGRSMRYHVILICRPCHSQARKIRERTGERIDIEQGKTAK